MKFRFSSDLEINTDEKPWNTEGLRICLFGGAGSGKSWTAALLAEQFLSQGGTVVIFEPRAEYHTLKEKFDVVVVGGPFAKDLDFIATSPATYARAVVDKGISMVFYTTDEEDEEKLIDFTSKFMRYLLKYQEVRKRPVLIILEEVQEYAPKSPSGHVAPSWVYSRMIKAFKDGFLQGRKLNVVMVAISPRPQEVNFTIRQLANITFYGKFSPQDIGYIDRECLKWYRQREEIGWAGIYKASDLLDLDPGKFLVIRGAEAGYVRITEKRITSHGAETPILKFVAPRKVETKKAMTELVETLTKALEKERREKSEIEQLRKKLKTAQDLYGKLAKDYEALKLQAETLGKIKIELPRRREVDVTFIDKVKTQIVKELREKVMSVFDAYTPRKSEVLLPKQTSKEVYETWAPKLPSLCAKRILKFLTDNPGAKYTRAQIALKLGYSSRGGAFTEAIATLRRNNLIKVDGKLLWFNG